MEKFEATVELAKTLNQARLMANGIDTLGIQAQSGVYGEVASALKETLAYLVGRIHAEDAYQALLDGCTVEDVVKQS